MAARFDIHTTLIASRFTGRDGFAVVRAEAAVTGLRFGALGHGVNFRGDERALAGRCAR